MKKVAALLLIIHILSIAGIFASAETYTVMPCTISDASTTENVLITSSMQIESAVLCIALYNEASLIRWEFKNITITFGRNSFICSDISLEGATRYKVQVRDEDLNICSNVVAKSISNTLPCEILQTSTWNCVQIDSSIPIDNAILYIASYTENKKLVDVRQKNISLLIGTNCFEFEMLGRADAKNIEIYLWSSNLVPYATTLTLEVSQVYDVTFKDWNETVLKNEQIYEGESAIPPNSPTRAGYIFTGWDRLYKNIQGNTVITAQYVADTALNVFSLEEKAANIGDTFTMLLTLDGTIKLCGFDFELCYDTSVLELVSYDDELSVDLVSSHNSQNGQLRFNYSSGIKNRTKRAEVIELTFRVLNTEKAYSEVSLKPVSVICLNENNDILSAESVAIDGRVFIDEN